jgi:hypothetical protein
LFTQSKPELQMLFGVASLALLGRWYAMELHTGLCADTANASIGTEKRVQGAKRGCALNVGLIRDH